MGKLKYLVIHCTATPEGVRCLRRTSVNGILLRCVREEEDGSRWAIPTCFT